MIARVGDEIVIDGPHVGDEPKSAEILEVLHSGGADHYRVRWDDGHEALFFPGSDAHTVRRAAS